MMDLHQARQRFAAATHHRIALVLLALVAISGSAIGGAYIGRHGRWTAGSPTQRTVRTTSATAREQRLALEQYRASEREHALADQSLPRQAAMDAYRSGEIATRSGDTNERQRALELYRAGEHAASATPDTWRRAYDLYRDGEIAARRSS